MVLLLHTSPGTYITPLCSYNGGRDVHDVSLSTLAIRLELSKHDTNCARPLGWRAMMVSLYAKFASACFQCGSGLLICPACVHHIGFTDIFSMGASLRGSWLDMALHP